MATFDVYSLIYHYLIIISPYDISVNVIYCIHVTVPPGNTGCRVTVKFTHWPLVNFNITNESVPQRLERQAPAAQDAAGACIPGYYSK